MLELINERVDDTTKIIEREYDCKLKVTLEGNELTPTIAGAVVNITGVSTKKHAENARVTLQIKHDVGQKVFFDNGFAKSISKLMGYRVDFDEYKLQQNGIARMYADVYFGEH